MQDYDSLSEPADAAMISLTSTDFYSASEMTEILRRICEHLGIPFGANRVFPSLADFDVERRTLTDVESLNAVGRHFGIRFREMVGSVRDLMNTVSDSGPVLVRPSCTTGSDDQGAMLVLSVLGTRKLLIHQNGLDRRVSPRRLSKQLSADESGNYRWLLIQPMLAAENASRFNYTGTTSPGKMKPLKRLVAFLKPESEDIRTILIFSIVIGLLSLTTPLAVEAVVNTIAFGRYLQPLIVLSLIVLVFLGFRAGLNVLMHVVTEVIQRKLFVRTVEDLAYRLTRVPLTTWNHYHGPELVNRFFDIVSVQKITSKLMLDTLMLLLQTVIGLSVLAFYHPFLLGYDIGLLIMMTVVLWLIGNGAIRTATEESELKYETAAWLQEIVRHPSTFKFNGGLGFAINRADELAARYITHRQSHFRILLRQISFSMAMQVLAAVALLALGGFLVIDGQMTLGQLVAAELIVTVILGSFAKIGKDLESFYDLMASVDKLGKLFDLPIEEVNKMQLSRRQGPGVLTMANVQLVDNEPADLEFQAGHSYALYGLSELKRTRLIQSLIGQSRLESGHILLNDFRVDAISAESLQETVSLVKEIELFEGTVDENVRMGRPNVGSQEANRVIERLGLQSVIATLPDGLLTEIKICGFPLSQGQAIRLILARALISKPSVLFIDGLLDRLSDRDTADVLQRLESFKRDTTMVISTGRKTVVQWCDQSLDVSDRVWKLEKFTG